MLVSCQSFQFPFTSALWKWKTSSSSSQCSGGGLSGQYVAIAHLRMSDSVTGCDVVSSPHTPLARIISSVTSVSGASLIVLGASIHPAPSKHTRAPA